MSDDFDFDLDLSPKKNNISKFNNIENEPAKQTLTLMDKLALLKNAKSNNKNEDFTENSKQANNSNKEAPKTDLKKEKENSNGIQNNNVSNLQKMLSKIKSNNDSLKKQTNFLSNNDESKKVVSNDLFDFDEKPNNNHKNNEKNFEKNYKTMNILDTVKVNENYNKDFKDKNYNNKNNQLLFEDNNLLSEENNDKSNLDLTESIQEIEDIIELPEKKEEINPKNNFDKNKYETKENIIPTNKEIEKALDKMNLLNLNKKDKNNEINGRNKEDSLDILISESNLNEIDFIEENKLISNENSKYNISVKDSKNYKNNYHKLEEIKNTKGLNESKGSFDIDTDEEIERKNQEMNKKNKNETLLNKPNEEFNNLNNSDLIENLLNTNNKNNQKLIPSKINNEIKINKNIDKNIINNNKNPFQYRDSNLSDSRKIDDFNISQNLVNLSKEIQEYKSSSDVNNIKTNPEPLKEIKNSKLDSISIPSNGQKASFNNSEKKIPEINKSIFSNNNINNVDNNNIKNSILSKKDSIGIQSTKNKLDDSLFDRKDSFKETNNLISEKAKENLSKIQKKPEEIKPVAEKNIKDLFKFDDDDEDEELLNNNHININSNMNNIFKVEKKEEENLNLEKNKLDEELNSKIPTSRVNIPVSLINEDKNPIINEVKIVKKIEDSIIDVDDIPEIEENDEEDSNIVNLDKKDVKVDKNISNLKNDSNNFFSNNSNNIINKPKENIEINNNKKTIEEKKIEKINPVQNKDVNENKNVKNNKIEEKKPVKKEEEKPKIQEPIKVAPKEEAKKPKVEENKNIPIKKEVESKKNEEKKTQIKNDPKIKSYSIKAEIIDSNENDENMHINSQNVIELVGNKKNNNEPPINKQENKENNSKIIPIKENNPKNNINVNNNMNNNINNKILKTEESNIFLTSHDESQIKKHNNNNISQEIQETEMNIINEKEDLKTQKKVEEKKKKKDSDENNKDTDRISVSSNQTKVDSSKYKIFIDFNEPEKNEVHLNEILGGSTFDEKVKEKNIRFLLRRKSIIINELFTSFTLKEFNLINRIKKIPFNYTLKVEQILNEYQNENDYDNLFKKAIGDDNNNKQNLMKLLQKDKIKDKSYYLFENVSCLYNIEAFTERYNLTNNLFNVNWEPAKVLKSRYDEEEIINTIYKKIDNLQKIGDNHIKNSEPNEENKILVSEGGNIRINSLGDDYKSEIEDKRKNTKNNNLNTSKNLSNINNNNENSIPYNLTLLKNEIRCWRESASDGDSFYRMFMFSLIEYYILNKNLHEIKKILFDVNRIYESSSNKTQKKISYLFSTKKIDYSIVVIIFNLIIEALKSNQIEKAYDILLNAYNLEDKSFDLILIGYMRIVLWLIISETHNSPEAIALDNKAKNEKAKKEYEDVNFETINTFQLEPFKLSFNLAATVFNVNLEIIYLDTIPNTNHPEDKIKCSKVRFNTNSIHEIPTINLLYNFNSYGKYYTNVFYEKNKNIIGKYYSKINKKILIEDKYLCDKCGKKTKKVIFKKYDYASCYDCLKHYLELIIIDRVKFYEIENFLCREYYCRPLSIKSKFVIDDYDYLSLFGITLSSHFMEMIRKCCFNCDAIKLDEPIYCLDCSCNFCKTCLYTKISELTNNNFVLNTFEKNLFFNTDPKDKLCGCNTMFDIDSALKTLKINLDAHKKNANKRLDEVVKILCLKCGCDSRNNEDGISNRSGNNLNFTTIKIKEAQVNENKPPIVNQPKINKKKSLPQNPIQKNEEEDKYVSNSDHIICNNCIEDYSRSLINNNNNNNENNKNKKENKYNEKNSQENSSTIFCNICEADHSIDAKILNNILKKKNCCQGGCEIF